MGRKKHHDGAIFGGVPPVRAGVVAVRLAVFPPVLISFKPGARYFVKLGMRSWKPSEGTKVTPLSEVLAPFSRAYWP